MNSSQPDFEYSSPQVDESGQEDFSITTPNDIEEISALDDKKEVLLFVEPENSELKTDSIGKPIGQSPIADTDVLAQTGDTSTSSNSEFENETSNISDDVISSQSLPLYNSEELKETDNNPPALESDLKEDYNSVAGKKVNTIRKQKQKVANPGTTNKKIDYSRIRVTTPDSLRLAFQDILQRQASMLPSEGASIKQALKNETRLVSINQPLNVFRLIIILLMLLLLGSQRYSWMSLGFMSNESGHYFLMMILTLSFLVNWHVFYVALREIKYFFFSFRVMLMISSIIGLLNMFYFSNENSLEAILAITWCVLGIIDTNQSIIRRSTYKNALSNRYTNSIRMAQHAWEKRDCIGISKPSYIGLVRHMNEPDVFNSLYSLFGLLYFLFVLLISTYISSMQDRHFIPTFSFLLCVGTPVSFVFFSTHIYDLVYKKILRKGIAAGWYGVKKLAGNKMLLLSDDTVFPKGSILCKSVKKYINVSETSLISYAASIAHEAKFGLDEVVAQIMEDTHASFIHVSNCKVEDGGASGIIFSDHVLIGTARYMELHGIKLPQKYGSLSIFIAIEGMLAAELEIRFAHKHTAKNAFRTLMKDKNLSALVVAKSPYMTPKFFQKHFAAPMARVLCPKAATRLKLNELSILFDSSVCGYIRHNGLDPCSFVIAGSRRIYKAALFITIATIIFEFLIVFYCAFLMSKGNVLVIGPQLILLNIIISLFLKISCELYSNL